MTGEPTMHVVGNLTDDPRLTYAPSGVAVCGFTVASTPRRFNRQTNEWEDGVTLFQSCTAFREHAENIAETFARGMRVIVAGQLQAQEWETKEGEKRRGTNLLVEECGPGLKYAAAVVNKRHRDAQPPATPPGAGRNWDGQNDAWTTGGGFGDSPAAGW